MKKTIICMLALVTMFFAFTTVVFADEPSKPVLQGEETTGQLYKMKEKELNSIEDYKAAYGSDSYGMAAYILNKVRIFSIPVCFVGIALSAIHQYVLGIRKLDVRDKGFNFMIATITVGVICQILPLVFAIVVKGWRG